MKSVTIRTLCLPRCIRPHRLLMHVCRRYKIAVVSAGVALASQFVKTPPKIDSAGTGTGAGAGAGAGAGTTSAPPCACFSSPADAEQVLPIPLVRLNKAGLHLYASKTVHSETCTHYVAELVALPLASSMDDLRATALLQSASQHAAGYARAATDGKNALHYNLAAVSVNTKEASRRGSQPGSRDDGSKTVGGEQHKLDTAHRTLASDIRALVATSRFLPGVRARAQPRQGMPVAWVYSTRRSIPSEVPSSPAVVRSSGGWAYPMCTWPHATEHAVAWLCSSIAECTMPSWRMDAMSW